MFWNKHPALFLGIIAYLVTVAVLTPSWELLIPALCIIPTMHHTRKSLVILGVLTLCIIGSVHILTCSFPTLFEDEKSAKGQAFFTIEEVSQAERFGKPFWKAKLRLTQFIAHDGTLVASNIPSSMYLKKWEELPSCYNKYQVTGYLQRHANTVVFQPESQKKWQECGYTFSLAELRLQAKLHMKCFLRAYLPPGQSRQFLEGLFIGEFQDQALGDNLRRFGLTHIMVVSGFHFSLLALIMGCVLRLFLPWRIALICLLVVVTCYFIFVGTTASIIRAWIAVCSVLVAKLLGNKTTGLNALGLGLLTIACIEPTFCVQLGFQLSFLATLAILLYYPICDHYFQKLLPKRQVMQVLELSYLDQLSHITVVFLRKSLALTCAVNLFMFPVLLFIFQSFPMWSIIYNLFFPLIASLSLFLLCIACLVWWIPLLGQGLFDLANVLTDALLTTVSYIPKGLDCTIHCSMMSAWQVVLCITLLFYIGSQKEELSSIPSP